jgi:hypothetical protein
LVFAPWGLGLFLGPILYYLCTLVLINKIFAVKKKKFLPSPLSF